MNHYRMAAVTGFCYTVPMALWTLPLLLEADSWEQANAVLQQAGNAILLLQGTAVVLAVPGFLARLKSPQALAAVLLLIATPWPLLALAWLAGSMALAPLLFSQLAIPATGILLHWAVHKPLQKPARRRLLAPTLQVTALVLIIQLYNHGLAGLVTG